LATGVSTRPATRTFRHEAVFYRGLDGLVGVLTPFVRAGLDAGEAVLVAEPPDRAAALQRALGTDAAEVEFLDMEQVGRNPARIIPAWRAFVASHPGQSVRGVGEPAWPGRRPIELEECRLHESLLNMAFDDVDSTFRLLCPYDADNLPEYVLAAAELTHPEVDESRVQGRYAGHAHAVDEFERTLLEPTTAQTMRVSFGPHDLSGLRSVVRRVSQLAGLRAEVVDDLVLATHELATNSVAHGGGSGVLRSWRDPHALVIEVSDAGLISDPLVGREQATMIDEGGRGVWIANQLCDLVQVRSSAGGTVVRLHTWLQ